jgi:hypothetical protein
MRRMDASVGWLGEHVNHNALVWASLRAIVFVGWRKNAV